MEEKIAASPTNTFDIEPKVIVDEGISINININELSTWLINSEMALLSLLTALVQQTRGPHILGKTLQAGQVNEIRTRPRCICNILSE